MSLRIEVCLYSDLQNLTRSNAPIPQSLSEEIYYPSPYYSHSCFPMGYLDVRMSGAPMHLHCLFLLYVLQISTCSLLHLLLVFLKFHFLNDNHPDLFNMQLSLPHPPPILPTNAFYLIFITKHLPPSSTAHFTKCQTPSIVSYTIILL